MNAEKPKKKKPPAELDFSSLKDVERSRTSKSTTKASRKRPGQDDEDTLPPRPRRGVKTRKEGSIVKDPVRLNNKARPKTKTTSSLPQVVTKPPAPIVALPALPPAKTKLSKTRERLNSIVADDAESILQLLESDSDSVSGRIHKRLLQSLIEAVAHAEHNVRESKGQKSVYQLNSLITSIRELLIDVQSTRDKGLLGNTIVEQTIRPNFLDIGMDYVRDTEILKTRLRGILPNDVYQKVAELQDTFTSNFAQSLQTRYALIQESIIKHLQG